MRLVAITSVATLFGMSFVLVSGLSDAPDFRSPRGLKQATRADVAARLAGGPDKTYAAKRQGTSPPPSGPCGDPSNGGGNFGCSYQTYCSTQVTGTDVVTSGTQTSFAACLVACDSSAFCGAISYQLSTGLCVEYRNVDITQTASVDYESAIIISCSE